MPKVSFNLLEKFISDPSLEETSSNKIQLEKLKIILKNIILSELTERQRQVLILYFYKNMKMVDIAKILNINKSTVSRTIKRSTEKIHKYIKYYSFR